MQKGDVVLLDGTDEVLITWKGGSLALVKPVTASEKEEGTGVALTRLSEKGTIIVPEDQQKYLDHDII